MNNIINNEKRKLISENINTGNKLLNDIESSEIAGEENYISYNKTTPEVLNAIFRIFYAVKGTAFFIDSQTITNITYETKILLAIFKKEKIVLCSEHLSLLYRTSDFIKNILNIIEKQLIKKTTLVCDHAAKINNDILHFCTEPSKNEP